MNRELEVAYLAGVLDSDGWFTIHLNTKQSANPTYSPDFGINQVEPHAIDLVQKLFGGRTSVIDYSKHKANRFSTKPMYHWSPDKLGMAIILKELIPYLRIKRKQAEILLALRTDIVFHGRTGGREKKCLSPQTVEYRTKLYQQFREIQPPRVATTECVDSLETGEKRQSDLHSNMQTSAEMSEVLGSNANAA